MHQRAICGQNKGVLTFELDSVNFAATLKVKLFYFAQEYY